MSAEKSLKERLADARAEKEKKTAALAAAADARELALLELEAKLEAEHGPRGSGFEIVDTLDGPVAVKLGPAVLHTKFQASSAKDITDRTLHDYVFPNVVHPDQATYLQMVDKRPAIALRCASALATLYGAKAAGDEAKF